MAIAMYFFADRSSVGVKSARSQRRFLADPIHNRCDTTFHGLEFTSSDMDGRPHLFHNLPFIPPRMLHRYQIILFADRGTRM